MIPTASFWPWETGGLRRLGTAWAPPRGSHSVAEMETGCFQGCSATKQCCVSTRSPVGCPRSWEPPFVVLLLGQPWASGCPSLDGGALSSWLFSVGCSPSSSAAALLRCPRCSHREAQSSLPLSRALLDAPLIPMDTDSVLEYARPAAEGVSTSSFV